MPCCSRARNKYKKATRIGRNPTTSWTKNQKTELKTKFLISRIMVAEMTKMGLFGVAKRRLKLRETLCLIGRRKAWSNMEEKNIPL